MSKTQSEKLIDLDKKQFKLLSGILQSHVPNKTVWAYGSRVTWKASEKSDIDLVIFDAHSGEIGELKEAFEESELLISVDVLDWESIPDNFKENIKKKYVVVQERSIPTGWREIKLGEIGTFRGGVTSIKKDDYGFGTPFITYKNIYNNSKVHTENLELMNVPQEDVAKLQCLWGDIFFTASSETPDEVAISSVLLNKVENLTFNGFSKRFRLNNFKTLMPEYARYLFRDRSFRREVNKRVTGDVRFNISQSSLSEITIYIPPLPEQKVIAEALSSLDDKIDLLRRQNKTLEDMAQTLFRKWFVEDANKNWKKVKLRDIAEIEHGEKAKKGERCYLEIGDIDISTKDYNIKNKEKLTVAGAVKVPEKTLLISKVRPTRGAVTITTSEINISSAFTRIKFSPCAYAIINRKPFFEYLGNVSRGSTYPTCKDEDILDYDIRVQNLTTVNKFEEITAPLFNKHHRNKFHIYNLEELRDTLLPKLISGQVIALY